MKRVIFLQAERIGTLGIAADDTAVTDLFFGDRPKPGMCEGYTPLLRRAAAELEEYFAGTRREFTFPVCAAGTPFQQRVWRALREIPYGTTRSYAQVAAAIGQPGACRAVGMANRRNPLAVVVPCHRVVGSDGSLTGYAAGTEIKRRLLELELEKAL